MREAGGQDRQEAGAVCEAGPLRNEGAFFLKGGMESKTEIKRQPRKH